MERADHAARGQRGLGSSGVPVPADELEATFIQFIPIIERATAETLEVANAGWGGHVQGRPLYTQQGELVTRRSIGAEQYGRFMIDVFEEGVRRDIGRVYVQMFDTALTNWVGEPPPGCASTPRPAGCSSRLSTTAISTAAITSSSPTICWGTSPRRR